MTAAAAAATTGPWKFSSVITVVTILVCVVLYTISFFSTPSPCAIVAIQVVTGTRAPTTRITQYFFPPSPQLFPQQKATTVSPTALSTHPSAATRTSRTKEAKSSAEEYSSFESAFYESSEAEKDVAKTKTQLPLLALADVMCLVHVESVTALTPEQALAAVSHKDGFQEVSQSIWRKILGVLLQEGEINILDKLVAAYFSSQRHHRTGNETISEEESSILRSTPAGPYAAHRYNAKLKMLNPLQLLMDYPLSYILAVKLKLATGEIPFFASFLTANFVTVVHPLFGVAAAVMFYKSLDSRGCLQLRYARTGCILFSFRNFLDTLDGVVARVQKYGVIGQQTEEQIANLENKKQIGQITLGLNGHSLDMIMDFIGSFIPFLALVIITARMQQLKSLTMSRFAVRFFSSCYLTSRFFSEFYAIPRSPVGSTVEMGERIGDDPPCGRQLIGEDSGCNEIPKSPVKKHTLVVVTSQGDQQVQSPTLLLETERFGGTTSTTQSSKFTRFLHKALLLNHYCMQKVHLFDPLPTAAVGEEKLRKNEKEILLVRAIALIGLFFVAVTSAVWESWMIRYSNLFDIFSSSNGGLANFEANSVHLKLNQFLWSFTMGDATLSIYMICLWFGVLWEFVQFYFFVMYPWLIFLSMYSMYVWLFVVRSNPAAAAIIESEHYKWT